MDGVLADFEGHLKTLFKDQMLPDEFSEEYKKRVGPAKFWKDIENIDDFWITIPPLHDNLPEIWKSLHKKFPHIMILSSPSRDKHCIPQKKEWLIKNIGPGVGSIFEKNKYIYACPKSVLIDDNKDKLKDWTSNGGHSIFFEGFNDKLWIELNKIKN